MSTVHEGKRNPTLRLGILALVSLVCFCLATGCRFAKRNESASIPPDELRILMRGFNEDFSTEIQRVCDLAVASQPDDPDRQRMALVWKMRIIPLCRSFLDHPDAKVTFVDTWALCAQVQELVDESTKGAGAEFAGLSGTGEATAKRLLGRIERIGETFLTPEQLEETREPIMAFAESHEIGERFFAYHRTHRTEGEDLGPFMTGLVTRPLNALNPFSGVSETAVAIHEVSESAGSFRDAVLDLPDILRWQTELMLHDLRHSEEVTSAIASIDEVAGNSTRLTDLAVELPEEVRRTLDESTVTIEKLEPVVVSATEFMERFNAAGATWVTTFQALQEMVASFVPEKDPDAPAPDPENPPRPFDILDYAKTAEQLTATAAELRELLDDTRSVAGGEELRNVASSVDETARSTVDHLIWRIGQLALVLLAGIAGLRVLWVHTGRARIAPGPKPSSGPVQPDTIAKFKRSQ